jgi:hypothetical protein
VTGAAFALALVAVAALALWGWRMWLDAREGALREYREELAAVRKQYEDLERNYRVQAGKNFK